MRRKSTWFVLLSVAVLGTALHYAVKVFATPASGYTSTTIAMATLGSIDVTNYFVPHKGPAWLSFDKTVGKSDLYVQQNVWQPGGSTGWHSHPGHSYIIVTAGTVTEYEGNDRTCTPHVYATGAAFVDPGGDHVHILLNEGSVEAQTIAVQLIPTGQPRRIDEPDPGHCTIPGGN